MKIYHGNGWFPMEKYFGHEVFPGGLFILLSFADVKKVTPKPHINGFFLDSGAFGAWSRGVVLRVEDYIAHVQANGHHFEVVANLDVIGDPVATWENYVKMREAGLNPMPVWHFGEDISWLHRYAAETDYIGLGGIAKAGRQSRYRFFDAAFEAYPAMKYHGFGMTSVELIKKYPWHTIDSTAAIMVGVSGGIHSPWGAFRVSDGSAMNHLQTLGESKKEALFDWVRSLGRSPEKIQQADTFGTAERLMVNYLFLESLKVHVPEVHAPKIHSRSLL